MYEELIETLRLYGLTNGTSLGRHMGIMDEAADAIAALQAENAEKDGEITKLKLEKELMRQEWDESQAALSRVEAERDALAALINKSALKPIQECKHYKKCYQKAADEMHMMKCPICDHWECRGAQGEG